MEMFRRGAFKSSFVVVNRIILEIRLPQTLEKVDLVINVLFVT